METASGQQMEQQIHEFSRQLYEKRPDWVTFYREILGRDGLVRRLFPTVESLAEFKETGTYREILRMLAELRTGGPPPSQQQEPTKVITVRLPESLYEALNDEADELHTTVNKLCISKLLQFIDEKLVPPRRSASRVRHISGTD